MADAYRSRIGSESALAARSLRGFALSAASLLFVAAESLCAQPLNRSVNPVYVEDAPRAEEMLERAEGQIAENPAETLRLLQELLDDDAMRLVAADPSDRERFISVRRAVLNILQRHPELRDAHRRRETPGATRMLAEGELEAVARTRPLTTPGLHAQLKLAQQALEEGRFRTALFRIEAAHGHPDLVGTIRLHAALIEGLAAHHLGRSDRADLALAELQADPEGRAFADYLSERRRSEALPGPRRATTVYDRAVTDDLDQLVAQPIWTSELVPPDISAPSGAPTIPPPRRRVRPAMFDTPGVTATIADDVIYVHEGTIIRAFNRFTARPVWAQPFRDRDPRAGELRGEESPGDLSVVTVADDHLIALVGQSDALGMMNHGAVVSLHAATGLLRWKTTFGMTGDAMPEGLFPHGQALVFDDHVFVLARQITPERLTNTYLVSLDVHTGRVRWLRFVASSGNRSSLARPLSTLDVHDDRLLVTTPIGAVTLVQPETGEFVWLRREWVPAAFRETTGRVHEVQSPVVINDRLYVLSADRREVLSIHLHDGRLLAQFDAGARDGWNNPAYLLGDESTIYSIGSDVRAFDPEAPEGPIWSFPPLHDPERRVPIGGRVQITSDALLVPTRDGLFVLDRRDGRVISRVDVDGPGHPVAGDGQLIVTSADRLGAFMSIERAEAMLRERITEDPADPQPAISLARLGLRGERNTLIMESVDLTLSAAALGDELAEYAARRDLFEVLLDRHRMNTAREAALYDAMGRTARHPSDRVEHLLAHAEWLSDRDPQAAAALCARILDDPELRSVERVEDHMLSAAHRRAARVLDALVEEHGRDVRAAADALAEERLRAALAAEDEEALGSIVRWFSCSPAGLQAALAASDLAARRGRPDQGDDVLRSLLMQLPAERTPPMIIERLFDRIPESEASARLLRLLAARKPDLQVNIRGRSRLLADAVSEIIELADLRPDVGRPDGDLRLISGTMVPIAAQAAIVEPARLPLLLFDGTHLRAHETNELGMLWETSLDDIDAQLLTADADRLMLFSPGRSNDPRFADDPALVTIDRSSGERLWRTDAVDRLLDLPMLRARQVQELMPNQLPFDPTEVLTAAVGSRAFLVRRGGGAAAFRTAGEGNPEWTHRRTLDQVHHVLAHPGGLVLIGRDRGDGPATTRGEPIILLLDAQTGATRARVRPLTRTGVAWARVDSMGRLLIGASEGIELIDLWASERLWANRMPMLADSRNGELGATSLIVEDRTGLLNLIDLESGAPRGALEPIVPGDWESSQVERAIPDDDGTWLIRFAGRIVRYDDQGAVIGADSVHETRSYVGLAPTVSGMIVLSLHDNRQVRQPGEDRLRMQRNYRVYTLAADGRLIGEPLALPPMLRRLQSMRAVHRWLLLSTDAQTIAIPGRPIDGPG